MPDRRSFLTRLGVTGLMLASATPAGAQSVPESSPSPQADSSATPPSTRETNAPKRIKGPSAVAIAVAATMRRFDPKLDDAELAIIAAAIDDNVGAGAVLNPKKRRLKNSDEPATHFAAAIR